MGFQNIILLVVGFGLIVFVHELGHFLAAKYVGIKVEQFALGFGQAMLSWRKGLGFRAGSSEKEYTQRVAERAAEIAAAGAKAENEAEGKIEPTASQRKAAEQEFGETEYRVNWIPLGGYVKMLGQDDTKPGLVIEDPRSYTSKSVGARMLVISAGVIMNIIFAGLAFMILFMTGLKVPQAVVGGITPMTPAQSAVTSDGQLAPLQVGDRILAINGAPQHNDFRKIALNTALAKKGQPLEVEVKRVDGQVQKVFITPEAMGAGSLRLLGIGISQPRVLKAPNFADPEDRKAYKEIPQDVRILNAGDTITQVNGKDVQVDQYYKLDEALQQSGGHAVDLTVKSADGTIRQVSVKPQIASPAIKDGLNLAGMEPRVAIEDTLKGSPLADKVKRGDVVLAIASAGDVKHDPSAEEFINRVHKAGDQGEKISLTLLRGDEQIKINDVQASVRLESGRGLGVGLEPDENHPVMAAAIEGSPAAVIPAGSTIKSINGTPVANWADMLTQLRKADPAKPVTVVAEGPAGGPEATYQLKLRPDDEKLVANLRYTLPPGFLLDEMSDSRTTSNPVLAAWWGVQETRDSLLQVYLTLRRLFEGSVPFSGMMGPVGMFAVGTKVASQGIDYLLWFLAIISANLAVVNFLPIPVVDGGHFLFLIIEKIQGRPVSEKTMVVAQYIGLALIGAVFLMVTYQDILRMLTVH